MAEPGASTLGRLARDVRRRLAEAGVADAALDARLLVTEIAGQPAAALVSRPDSELPDATAARIHQATERRIAGEPSHRILGFREFYGLRLALSPSTLEPRPDTETLIELALPFVRNAAAVHGRCRILDLGTGTGALALALLAAVPAAHALATDLSADALATALSNARSLGLADRFEAVRSDWFSAVDGRFDAIVSNPPYVRSGEIDALDRAVRLFDPRLALDGGEDGLAAYRSIAGSASAHLEPGGCVALEIGHDQRDDVRALFEAQGFRLAAEKKDLGGNDRALAFIR